MQDILDFGVLANTYSSACESNHKVNSKDCAEHTQLRKSTLFVQTAIRYVENLTNEKGMLMVIGPPDNETEDGAKQLVKTSGTVFRVYFKKTKE